MIKFILKHIRYKNKLNIKKLRESVICKYYFYLNQFKIIINFIKLYMTFNIDNIANPDIYNIIKDFVTCPLCENVLDEPSICKQCEKM